MELIEIIQSSITYFTGCVVLLMFLSYTIYKLKDRTRLKSYEIVEDDNKIDVKKNIKVNYTPISKNKNFTFVTTSNEKLEVNSSYKVVSKENKGKKNKEKFTVVTFM
ncbi:MAG: hypothetical protein ACM3O3_01830 [Syntrophothermus sp.]